MHRKLTEIDQDWERTNEVLAQIHQEVREACAPKEKDEIKLKELRERSVAVHNERIAINLRQLKTVAQRDANRRAAWAILMAPPKTRGEAEAIAGMFDNI